MSAQPWPPNEQAGALLGLYDRALPVVYGYLRARCDQDAVAEDLTAETFMAAVDAVRRDDPPTLSTAWLVGVARHKLADHWRRRQRDQRRFGALTEAAPTADDPWDVELDLLVARHTLATLAPQHRAALTLRYLDDLAVPEVAAVMGRTTTATEALLVRARAAFRRAYTVEGNDA